MNNQKTVVKINYLLEIIIIVILYNELTPVSLRTHSLNLLTDIHIRVRVVLVYLVGLRRSIFVVDKSLPIILHKRIIDFLRRVAVIDLLIILMRFEDLRRGLMEIVITVWVQDRRLGNFNWGVEIRFFWLIVWRLVFWLL